MKMYFATKVSPKTLLFFTVFIPWAISNVGMATGKSLNLRIGFDLMPGRNGVPSLRIRNFQGSSEINRRAPREEETARVETVIRADSFSESNEKKYKKDDSSSSDSQSSTDDDDNNSAPNRYETNIRSTKGLKPAEYEPEENAGLHGRYENDGDSDDEGKRYKRAATLEASKRKGKRIIMLE